jgi:hypothetical protein
MYASVCNYGYSPDGKEVPNKGAPEKIFLESHVVFLLANRFIVLEPAFYRVGF